MKNMTFAAAGDAVILKRTPIGYSGFKDIYDFVNVAQAKFVNLETVLSNYENFPSTFSGGTWMNADPDVANDLMAYGFNFVGWANNHTLDYSYGGLYSTKKALDDRKIAHAGVGLNLYEASRPAILDLPSARVGMISLSTSFDDSSRAGNQSASQPGRPGLNYLRFSTEYIISAEHMKSLKEVAEATKMNAESDNERREGFLPPLENDKLQLKNLKFRIGEKEGMHTKCNSADLKRITDIISDAKNYLDYIIVLAHSHEIKSSYTEPGEFFEEFCHAAIDSGASAVIGGGTHQLKPIEIYNGCPIFYSLGNFIFQTNSVRLLPYDFMDKLGFDLNMTASQALNARSKNGTRGLHTDKKNFQSVIPFFKFEDDKLTKLILKPIELGFKEPLSYNGLPHVADSDDAFEIFERLQKISKNYGTKFKFDGNNIEAEL